VLYGIWLGLFGTPGQQLRWMKSYLAMGTRSLCIMLRNVIWPRREIFRCSTSPHLKSSHDPSLFTHFVFLVKYGKIKESERGRVAAIAIPPDVSASYPHHLT
jgi:hypothetical protein